MTLDLGMYGERETHMNRYHRLDPQEIDYETKISIGGLLGRAPGINIYGRKGRK